jgi:hypothetical protein
VTQLEYDKLLFPPLQNTTSLLAGLYQIVWCCVLLLLQASNSEVTQLEYHKALFPLSQIHHLLSADT